ncbi:ABC transporter permease [Candidatus Soleaferrea massiliensis]|uniref:ABC transporter permease n=1 Tax=Candidatus Soleaferrea massiliensis TaxID=1470354 RepID=UPI00058F161E|nr:FtsX-like permease family protein [Candidatus Soleaferrea massiliensis]
MLSKLSFRNVKRSVKDYTVYFITLTFAVAIFFVFNSIGSQEIMNILNESQRPYLEILDNLMSSISVFISVVLGFLIIFANNFLIKKRKKELGIYTTLGMSKTGVSFILFIETLLIGVLSLVVGLLVGIFLSQGLSLLTAKLFDVAMTEFHFVFSLDAMVKTVLYFGVIFLCVILFNIITVSRYKLIDLIYGGRKNQTLKTRNLTVSVILFILSVISLGVAYYLIIQNKLMAFDSQFLWSLILGAVGTLLFFMSLSGFALKLVKSSKRLYFRKLNMFTMRQINSKVNTTFISMTMICLMLFLTIGMLSTGLGITTALKNDVKFLTPYGVTAQISYDSNEIKDDPDLKSMFEKSGIDFDQYIEDYYQYKIYQPGDTMENMMSEAGLEKLPDALQPWATMPVLSIGVSDLNRLLEMQGKDGNYQLEENQCILLTDKRDLDPYVNEYFAQNRTVPYNGQEYEIKLDSIQPEVVVNSYQSMNYLMVVLPDDKLDAGPNNEFTLMLNANFKGDAEKAEKVFADLNSGRSGLILKPEGYEGPFSQYVITQQDVINNTAGILTMAIFIGIYIGFVFLITSAAVLALQQLSEAADNRQRYLILRKIGVEEKMISQSIFIQIFIYFCIPLFLAIIHSVVGIYVANNVVAIFGKSDTWITSAFTGGLLLVVYGLYFLATYTGYKNILKSKSLV